MQYGFQVTGGDPVPGDMRAEATEALRQILKRGYREICFAGKSLSTPLALELAEGSRVARVSLLQLTPLPAALRPVHGLRALAVIGTADPIYSTPECEESRRRGDMQWLVLPGVHHGLEVQDDWRESARVLTQVVSACEEFLVLPRTY